jgi:chemotaxis protein histidine kinase CheA
VGPRRRAATARTTSATAATTTSMATSRPPRAARTRNQPAVPPAPTPPQTEESQATINVSSLSLDQLLEAVGDRVRQEMQAAATAQPPANQPAVVGEAL